MNEKKEFSGAELILEALKQEGVKTVFGYPGGQVIPLFDALYKEPAIKVVLCRHEQAAVHAADGHARVSGKPGVVIVTSGPGATNTVTGIATANFDSVPMVVITGQVPRNMIGNDAFQEVDMVGITRPVTKHNYLVTQRNELGKMLKNTFHLASSGRPGPVVIDIPKDIQIESAVDCYPKEPQIRGFHPHYEAHSGQLKKAAKAINGARKPLFFIGGGLQSDEAAAAFMELQKKTGFPVVTSLMGLGVISCEHPQNLGFIGMHGSIPANLAISECDLIIGLGVRFDDRATGNVSRFAPNAKIIHVDIDPSSIARNVPADIPIVGDVTLFCSNILPFLNSIESFSSQNPWQEQIENFKIRQRQIETETAEKEIDKKNSPLTAREILAAFDETFPDSIVTTEVGQNQMWAAQYMKYHRARSWLTSGGLGTMGYGFPAALGAQMAVQEMSLSATIHKSDSTPANHRVIAVAGDGSFQMNIQELATCVQENLPIIILILNNGYLGMVRQWQEIFFDRRYSSTCLNSRSDCAEGCNSPGQNCSPYYPDFVAIAKAYGVTGLRAVTRDDLKKIMTELPAINGPVLVECIIEREENVWPIVPPGKGNDQMLYKGVKV